MKEKKKNIKCTMQLFDVSMLLIGGAMGFSRQHQAQSSSWKAGFGEGQGK